MNKVFVIADIHGCYVALQKLLAKINPDTNRDTIVFLGDYINRGPDSQKVIDFLLELRQSYRHVIFLMGNHEQIMLKYLHGESQELFLRMGGADTMKSYGLSEPWPTSLDGLLPETHVAFFEELLLYWQGDKHIFVHAGLQPGVHVSQQSADWLLWAREEFIHLDYSYSKKIIYGHTPFGQPKIDLNKIGIDTGAVYGGELTCLVLPEERFVSSG